MKYFRAIGLHTEIDPATNKPYDVIDAIITFGEDLEHAKLIGTSQTRIFQDGKFIFHQAPVKGSAELAEKDFEIQGAKLISAELESAKSGDKITSSKISFIRDKPDATKLTFTDGVDGKIYEVIARKKNVVEISSVENGIKTPVDKEHNPEIYARAAATIADIADQATNIYNDQMRFMLEEQERRKAPVKPQTMAKPVDPRKLIAAVPAQNSGKFI